VVRKIGMQARPHIEHLLGHKIYLELHVKVRPKWRQNEALLERYGI
jgi:GTP-binding protein Era